MGLLGALGEIIAAPIKIAGEIIESAGDVVDELVDDE